MTLKNIDIFRKIHIFYLNKRYGINKRKIDKNILKYKGNVDNNLNVKSMISLTSYGDRIKDVHYTIYSLFLQTYKPTKIVLWLSFAEFPNKEKDLPLSLINLKKYGLDIQWCKDLKSYKKLIPALIRYPDYIIITVDDDIYYRKDFLNKLIFSYEKDPNSIHVHRATKIVLSSDSSPIKYQLWKDSSTSSTSFNNFLKGAGGVLYPPYSLYKDVMREDIFMNLCPSADDIWFWAMAVLNNKTIKVVENNNKTYIYTNVEREFYNSSKTLHVINVQGGQNDIQIFNIFKYYPDLCTKLT